MGIEIKEGDIIGLPEVVVWQRDATELTEESNMKNAVVRRTLSLFLDVLSMKQCPDGNNPNDIQHGSYPGAWQRCCDQIENIWDS